MLRALNFFDKIYVINLDRRTDRWNEVQKEFDKMGILHRVERFSAIEIPENPARGNHLSHAECIHQADLSGARNVLLFEDDVCFFDNADELSWQAICDLPLDWDMFYLGINMDIFHAEQVSPHLAKLYGGFSTHAYAINSKMFKLLREVNLDERTIHNDVTYSSIMPAHNVYVTIPLVAGQVDSYSDIQKTIMSSNKIFLERFEQKLIRKS